MTSLAERVAHRLRKHSVRSLLLGVLLRRKFTRAGLLIREPGLPRIRIRNLGGSIEAENCTFFPGVRLECWSGATIRIGNGTYLNRNAEIIAQREVVVGRDCQISWDVVIMDTDQHGFGWEPPIAQPVRLGDRVWVGCRAIILKGVTIGDDAVVGAGSVVTRDVAAGSVVAGVPARLIRMR